VLHRVASALALERAVQVDGLVHRVVGAFDQPHRLGGVERTRVVVPGAAEQRRDVGEAHVGRQLRLPRPDQRLEVGAGRTDVAEDLDHLDLAVQRLERLAVADPHVVAAFHQRGAGVRVDRRRRGRGGVGPRLGAGGRVGRSGRAGSRRVARGGGGGSLRGGRRLPGRVGGRFLLRTGQQRQEQQGKDGEAKVHGRVSSCAKSGKGNRYGRPRAARSIATSAVAMRSACSWLDAWTRYLPATTSVGVPRSPLAMAKSRARRIRASTSGLAIATLNLAASTPSSRKKTASSSTLALLIGTVCAWWLARNRGAWTRSRTPSRSAAKQARA